MTHRTIRIFEDTTSTLYASNDGRLQVMMMEHPDASVDIYTIARENEDGTVDWVFSSEDRIKADAYIAGYDLAMERA